MLLTPDTFGSEPVGPLGPGVGHGGGGGLAGDRGQGRRGPAVGLHPAAVAPRPGHGGTQVPGGCWIVLQKVPSEGS